MLQGKPLRLVLALLAILLVLVITPFLASQSQPEAADLQIILVDSRLQIGQVLESLKRREDFAAVAKDRSTDPTASNGGYLGRQEISSLHPKIREALKGVALGQLTPVVELPGGYAVLKVLPVT